MWKFLRVNILRKTLLLLPVVSVFGCTPSGSSRSVDPHRDKEHYQVVTIEEQAAESVVRSATQFTLPRSREYESWSRARVFFATYIKQRPASIERLPGSGLRIQNSDRSLDEFLYSIEKYTAHNSVTYFVRCKPAQRISDPQKLYALRNRAHQNAKNVARFIREGQLELSLLH